MLQPVQPRLSIRTCLSDSITCWTGNLPKLAAASILAVLTTIILPIFWSAFGTGILLMCVAGLDAKSVSLRTVWTPFTKHPLRFLFISVWLPTVWIALALFSLAFAVGAVPLSRNARRTPDRTRYADGPAARDTP